MREASYQSASERRRAISLGLAILAHLLIVLLLLRLAPPLDNPPLATRQTSFALLPDRGDEPSPHKEHAERTKRAAAKAASKPAPAAKTPHATPPKPTATPPKPVSPFNLIPGGKALFDGADIAALPSHPEDNGGGAGDAGTGKDSVAAYGPGEGPGGQKLYNAQWYREPSDAQLSFYLPPNVAPGSWGEIACQTIDRYHVDNCRSLGDSPAGSGLGRAIREAAWQFLVLPPRLGGRTMVGAWVRIRIDFTERGAEIRGGRGR